MPPVEDHAVHERVKEKEGAVYGCWNKPRPTDGGGYFAPNGLAEIMDDRDNGLDARIGLVFVPYKFSTECRFDMSLTDQKCYGCEWRGSGEDYDAMVRSNGK